MFNLKYVGKRNFCLKKIIKHKLKLEIRENKNNLIRSEAINTEPFFFENKLTDLNKIFDVVIIGAGHNGLTAANYLVKKGQSVLILEKRHVVGGAAVTEELVEGYKIPRCSYLFGLYRKQIIEELFGFKKFKKEAKFYERKSEGITPTEKDGIFLCQGKSKKEFIEEIKKFSKKDAENFKEYQKFLERILKMVNPLMLLEPPSKKNLFSFNTLKLLKLLLLNITKVSELYHLLTSPAAYYLNKYFETDIVKSTLGVDSVIGTMKSPMTTGSAYILLHHVIGDIDSEGRWFYFEVKLNSLLQGGNGGFSNYLAKKALEKSAFIRLNSSVQNINTDKNGRVTGVTLEDGNIIHAKNVISNCDMNVTYKKLLTEEQREKLLPKDFLKGIELIDYNGAITKINLIVDRIPKMKCLKTLAKNDYDSDHFNNEVALKYMTGTIHINAESLEKIDDAYNEALYCQKPSTNPLIEMTIPSLLDKTLVPKDSKHQVICLFIQYCPTKLKVGTWDKQRKRDFAKKVYESLDKYFYDFSKSVIFEDILSPLDLETEFSLTGGNIFHGSIDLNSLFIARPVTGYSTHKQPLKNLWSCSSATHSGGGVLGAPGKLCADALLKSLD